MMHPPPGADRTVRYGARDGCRVLGLGGTRLHRSGPILVTDLLRTEVPPYLLA